jgi:hypothetical protein
VPGQTLVLPTPAVAAAALNIPDPSIERYSSAGKSAKKAGAKGRAAGRAAKAHLAKEHTPKGQGKGQKAKGQTKGQTKAKAKQGKATALASARNGANPIQGLTNTKKHSGAGSTAGARTKLLARAD